MTTAIFFALVCIMFSCIKGLEKWLKLFMSILTGIASVFSIFDSYVNFSNQLADEECEQNENFISEMQSTDFFNAGAFSISTKGCDMEMSGSYHMDESTYIYTKSGFDKGKYHIEELINYDSNFDIFCTKIKENIGGSKSLDISVAGFADGVGCIPSYYNGDMGEFENVPYYSIGSNSEITAKEITLKTNKTLMSNEMYGFLRGVSIQKNLEKRFENIKMTKHPIYVGVTNRKGEDFRKVEIKIAIKNAYKYKQRKDNLKKIYNVIM